MSADAPVPAESPPGMVLVGWRCTNPDHQCMRALGEGDPGRPGDWSRWEHNATWVPVFAHAADLGEGLP